MTTKLHVTLKKSLCSEPNRAIKPKCFAYFGINPLHPAAGGGYLGFVSRRWVCFTAALVSGRALETCCLPGVCGSLNSHPSPNGIAPGSPGGTSLGRSKPSSHPIPYKAPWFHSPCAEIMLKPAATKQSPSNAPTVPSGIASTSGWDKPS